MTGIGPSASLDAALAASLRGAQAASERFGRAAGRIAAAGSETPRAPDPVGPPASGSSLLAVQQTSDLATEMIQMRVAQRAYEANLAVMRRADAMQEEAIRLLG